MPTTIQVPPDPLQSPLWEAMVQTYLSDHPIVFDPAVEVQLPPVTENQTQVPITVDARHLGAVDEIMVIGDLNPFPLTLKLRPHGAPARISFRMRIEQGSVIRAAVRKDGRWHIGGRYLDASGGGCSAPPVSEFKVDWEHLGEIRAKVWRESADALRLRLRIVHPMDTGLHKAPVYYIETLAVRDADGATLADLDLREPVAANPTLTLFVADPKRGDHLAIAARDTNGRDYEAKVPLGRVAGAPPAALREGRL